MAACVRLTVNATGGGPWGFRLYGGEDEPLIVAKLRKRSKAHDAGLQEGDCILGINSHSCRGISHATAMALVEGTNDIILEILRGSTDQHAIDAAFQELGSQLRPVPASALTTGASPVPRASQPSPSQHQAAPSQLPKFQHQTQFEATPQNQVVNGYSGATAPSPAKFERREETFREGDTTTHVTTETSEERLGGTTVTKVKRETVSQSYGQAPSQPMFKVANAGAQPSSKQGAWAPPGGGVSVNASDNVHVRHNPDQSITMTIGFNDSKENIAPAQGQPQQDAPLFKVSKFGVSSSNAPNKSPWEQPAAPIPSVSPQPGGDIPLLPDEEADYKSKVQSLQKPFPVQLQRILVESGVSSDQESSGSPDSPSYLTRRRMDSFEMDSDEDDFFAQRKKIFADSAFYDDPDHRYPTIDEQVKMARKVAMSLLAPANKRARGHRMFMRRMVKSQKWTADEETLEKDFEWGENVEEEKYYRPEPWAGGDEEQPKTWTPPQQPAAPMAPGPVPVPPPIPANLFQPQLPLGLSKKDERTKALSAEEFERMRLFESKSDHTQVSPAMCFSLANDLRNMKGKGGKLFAKRVARSEKWDQDSSDTAERVPKPNQDLINKIAMQAAAAGAPMNPFAEAAAPSPARAPAGSQGAPVNRLKDMVDPPKPKMTPWDAAVEYGTCEEAFSHLKGYNPYGRSQQGKIADNLDFAASQKASGPTPSSGAAPMSSLPTSGQPAKLPSDYSKAAKPWGSGNTSDSSAPGPSFSTTSSQSSSSSFKQETQSSSNKGFRPVSFKAPGAHTGNFQPSAASSSGGLGPGSSSFGGGASFGAGGGNDMGYCDL